MDELNQRITALEAEKKKEEELRNYMQLERVRGSASFAQAFLKELELRISCSSSGWFCKASSGLQRFKGKELQ